MTTLQRMLHRYPLFLAVLAVMLGDLAPARAETYQLNMVARPARIVYGDDNNVTITVTVRDSLGQPAPDGTQVFFHTTLGSIPTLRETQRGEVSVVLSNTTGPGQADVTATVGATYQQITVEYLGQGGVAATERQRLAYRVRANQAYYILDQQRFDLVDQAEFRTPSYTVQAGAIQYDVRTQRVMAQYHVQITAGDRTVTAEKLYLDVSGNQGSLVQVDPEVAYKSFTLPKLELTDDDKARQIDYTPLASDAARNWILCKEASVFPGQYIQFRRPQFWLNRFRFFSLPYHVVDLRSSTNSTLFNSEISLTSDAGLSVDFPVYFDASDSHMGALHLQHVTRGSSGYAGTDGLEINLQEEYLVGNSGDGGIYVDRLNQPSRSVSWDHVQTLGKTRMNMSASYDRYSEDTPYTKRLGFSASRTLGETDMYLSTNWSAMNADQDGYAELSLYPPALPLAKGGYNLTFKPYVGYTRSERTTQQLVTDPGTGTDPINKGGRAATTETKAVESNPYQGLDVGLGFPGYRLLGGTLTPSLSDGIRHESDGEISNELYAGLGYRRQFLRIFSASLRYAYNLSTSNQTSDSTPAQTVSLDLSGSSGRQWSMYGYASYDIGRDSLYGSASSTYFLPWDLGPNKTPRWFLRYNANVSTGTTTTINHLVSLGRAIGPYTLQVNYSPDGSNLLTGIGSGTGKHWAVELVRQGW